MTHEKKERSILLRLVAAAGAFAVIGGGVALADYVVSSSEPVVISDDVYTRTISIVSLTGGPGGVPSDVAKSGFADGSNPAEESANNKSGKGGTDNPNQAK